MRAYIFPSQVFVLTIHGYTRSIFNTQYTLRCDRVYIIKLKYDVHMKIQQQQQQINIELVVKTINQTEKYKSSAAHCMCVCEMCDRGCLITLHRTYEFICLPLATPKQFKWIFQSNVFFIFRWAFWKESISNGSATDWPDHKPFFYSLPFTIKN